MADAPTRVMWEGSVRAHDYLDQLAATAVAGFDGLGLTPVALHGGSALGQSLEDTLDAVGAHADAERHDVLVRRDARGLRA